jgi:hypothetical protein
MAQPRLFTDTYNSVYDDSFNFFIFWGPPRSSKTTIAGWVLHNLFDNDWNKVLMSFAFNLDQTMHRIENGIPNKIWTKNGFHNRLPGVCWDDFAASGGDKAVSQYDESFDLLKGSYDVLGTALTNLLITMVDPSAITNQLMLKYTGEIQVTEKGKYKFDKVQFEQDYKGWKPRIKKIPIEINTFDPWPKNIYQEYDQMRMSLVPEAFQRIRDAQSLSRVDVVLKLINAEDVNLLRLIQTKGAIKSSIAATEFGASYKQTVVRCKSRNLVNPMLCGHNYYKLDLSTLGIEVLKALDKNHDKENEIFKKGEPNANSS